MSPSPTSTTTCTYSLAYPATAFGSLNAAQLEAASLRIINTLNCGEDRMRAWPIGELDAEQDRPRGTEMVIWIYVTTPREDSEARARELADLFDDHLRAQFGVEPSLHQEFRALT